MNSQHANQNDQKQGTSSTLWSSVSLSSPGSSKSNSLPHLEKMGRISISRSGTIPSSKTSELGNIIDTNRVHLPIGTTPSANTPNGHSSKNTSILSEGVVCRICHDGDGKEVLISPCYCAGSMGLLHLSCLQKWLGSSNKTSCEICHFKFALQRRALPFVQFLKKPGSFYDRSIMILYLVVIFLLTPLVAVLTGFLINDINRFSTDAQPDETWIAVLTIVTFGFVVLGSMSFAYSMWKIIRLYRDWRMFHQQVTLLCKPSGQPNKDIGNVQRQRGKKVPRVSRSTLGCIRLQSIKVSVTGPMARYNRPQQPTSSSSSPTTMTPRTSKRHHQLSGCSSDRCRRNRVQGHSRQSMPSMDRMVRRKMPEHVRHLQQHPGEQRRTRCHDKEGINRASDSNIQYYNAEERARNLRAGNVRQNDRQSRHSSRYSSGRSSNFTQDSRQRNSLRTLDENTERKLFMHEERQRNLTNKSNMLTERRELIDNNTRNITAELESLNTATSAKNVFSRGNSPLGDDLQNNLPYDDFVTKWINEQKNVQNVLESDEKHLEYNDASTSNVCQANVLEEVPCEVTLPISKEYEQYETISSAQDPVTNKEIYIRFDSDPVTYKEINTISAEAPLTNKEINTLSAQYQVTNKEINSISAQDPVTNKEINTISAHEPVTNKEINTISAHDSVTNKEINISSASGPVTNKEINTISAHDPVTNKDINTISAQDPVTNKEIKTSSVQDPVTNEEINTSSAKDPITNEEINTSSAQDPVTNEEINTISAQDPVTNNEIEEKSNLHFVNLESDGIEETNFTIRAPATLSVSSSYTTCHTTCSNSSRGGNTGEDENNNSHVFEIKSQTYV